MLEGLNNWLLSIGIEEETAVYLAKIIFMTFAIILSVIADLVLRKIFVKIIIKAVKKTKNRLDDLLVNSHLLNRLVYLAPLLIIHFSVEVIFPEPTALLIVIKRVLSSAFVFVGMYAAVAALNGIEQFYRNFEISKKTPIKGYIQLVKIFMFVIGTVFIIATLINKSPWGILTSIGAMTAIVILIFKDTILGFVSSVQINANSMVEIGDWIQIPKYDADGAIIDITLNTVKVQNWDKTITTIPAYALISDSFKNWRGMQQSGGRRIKRSLYIDLNSIKFCDDKMLKRFKKFQYIKDYLKFKEKDIAKHNREHNIDTSEIINGRHLTNIGTFRAYVVEYLKHHSKINQAMTMIVRHLQPTEHGLPVEIYTFTNDTRWVNYEGIQADIFDHILAVLPKFDLRPYQNPSGWDITRTIISGR